MIYDLFLAWRGIVARPVQTLVTILVVTLAVALPVVTFALGDGARQGVIRASDPFGMLVVGAKGSAQQLVLNTILLQGLPVGNVRYDVFNRLTDDPRVALAVPLAFGDNVGGARIIGTDAGLLELRTEQTAPPAFQIARGAFFAGEFEAVLGSRAADALGLALGDTFVAAHGVEPGLQDDVHDDVYKVVGVFAPTGTPYDTAVYVSLESVWHAHADEPAAADDHADEPAAAALADDHADEPGAAGAADDHADEDAHTEGDVTAILVRPVGFVEQNQIWQEFYTSTEAQAAFPGAELGSLFDLLSQGERVLTVVGYIVFGIAALTVFLAVYSATLAREQTIAILRSLGSSRGSVFRMILFETLLVIVIGSLLGRLLGYAVAAAIGVAFAQQSAIAIPIRFLPTLEPVLWLVPLTLGVFAGLLPAVMAYRVNVVDKLFAS